MHEKILSKIKDKNISIGIIGLGYVGLPLAERFLQKKINVYGFETDKEKIKKLKKGISYIQSVKSKNLVQFRTKKGKVTSDYNLISKLDVVIICLPTPLKDYKTPDMSILKNCFNKLKKHLKENQVLILESTVYPGATRELFNIINRENKFNLGKNFSLIFSPERENPGDYNFSYNTTPKVLSGITENCKKIGKSIYGLISKKIHVAESIEVAEMSKLLENSFRQVNIGLINEIKLISERMNINIWDVIKAAKTKNFGFTAFSPGPGTGGHCIPIDPMYLVWASRKQNFLPKLIWASSRLNSSMPKLIYKKIKKMFKNKNKIKILFIGISYKKDVDDLRHSPALEIMQNFLNNGDEVNFHDPFIKKIKFNKNKEINSKNINIKNLKSNDVTIITTDHKKINYEYILKHSKIIIDTRGVYSEHKKINSNKIIFL